MIRRMQKKELDRIGQIWLQGNLDAHDFVDKNYWLDHLNEVKEQFQQADIFVYVEGNIKGFVGLKDDYIAGIFVDKKYRNQGIGRQLLNYLKQNYDQLILDVYLKNLAARSFYRQNDFKLNFTDIDRGNNEKEEQLIWIK
ncbi:GNAT family N-acetyltransferase [Companilactobacillus musae]|uniref:GNAT family N-acetyltransferase n=1 Tax=Companilactobacillus musae TaxID=1903258 RepID=UPI000E64EA46|nr:GNAT family N-acetyltransferase [Companilactobacillus musae]